MKHLLNPFDQPIGMPVSNWIPPEIPSRSPLHGRSCWLEPLDVDEHAEDLYRAYAADVDGLNWTYLPYGPFDSYSKYHDWLSSMCTSYDPQSYVIRPKQTGVPAGMASYLRMDPRNGSIEVGHLHYSESLKQTVAATEALYLMMKKVFELGYRRFEWKCDALNAPSRFAAERLGFSFEGIFRNATVYKGRNRDTAWFAIIDSDWPALHHAFSSWLDPNNFDQEGRQKVSLRSITQPLIKDHLTP